MRIAGLDVGSKTIGLALSDELLLTAQPVGVLRRRGTRADVAELVAWSREHQVAEVVVGLPLELSGREGHRARRVRVLASALEEAFCGPVRMWDERLSTRAVEQVLIEADVSRAKRRLHLDKLAASFILQGYLDWLRAGGAASAQADEEGKQ